MNMSRSKLLKTGRLRDLRPNTFSWWRRARFSTSREELERNRPTSADQMSFSRSHIEQTKEQAIVKRFVSELLKGDSKALALFTRLIHPDEERESSVAETPFRIGKSS